MKRKLPIFLLSAFVVSLIAVSCAKDNSVASNHRIQKRKYRSGYHIDLNGKNRSSKEESVPKEKENLAESISKKPKVNEKEVSNIETIDFQNLNIVSENFVLDKKTEEKEVNEVILTEIATEKGNSEVLLTINENNKSSSLSKQSSEIKKLAKKASVKSSTREDLEPVVYILLCIFIPFLAVGFATDWNTNDVILNLLLCLLCGLPGIIHAFIVCNRQGVL